MCGIAGALIYGGGGQVAKGDMAGMCHAMVHRGPDAEGVWLSPDGKIGLAHRRLTIIDLADAAGQPMANEDGESW
jgi:asparagine synthase (glutamine-hydrolysing)